MTVKDYLDSRIPYLVDELFADGAEKSPELAELDLDSYVGRECRELIDMAVMLDTKMLDIMTVLERDFRVLFWENVWHQMEVWYYG